MYSIYYAHDDMFRHLQVTKMYHKENLYRLQVLVVVQIHSFQRDLVVYRFIHMGFNIVYMCSRQSFRGMHIELMEVSSARLALDLLSRA
jgi:hypothetical protein